MIVFDIVSGFFLLFWLLLSITLKGASSLRMVSLDPCWKVYLVSLSFEINILRDDVLDL